jgi:hypothetical protein
MSAGPSDDLVHQLRSASRPASLLLDVDAVVQD